MAERKKKINKKHNQVRGSPPWGIQSFTMKKINTRVDNIYLADKELGKQKKVLIVTEKRTVISDHPKYSKTFLECYLPSTIPE